MSTGIYVEEKKENVIAGFVGALLFSLAGGIVWFILYQIGFISAISGIVGVFCAIKGYSLFAKKESVKGIIIAIICSLAVIVFAWYLCIAYDVYNEYQELLHITVPFGDIFSDPFAHITEEANSAYTTDLVMGIIFCVIGGAGYAVRSIQNAKRNGNKDSGVTVSTSDDVPCEEAPTTYINGEPTEK